MKILRNLGFMDQHRDPQPPLLYHLQSCCCAYCHKCATMSAVFLALHGHCPLPGISFSCPNPKVKKLVEPFLSCLSKKTFHKGCYFSAQLVLH